MIQKAKFIDSEKTEWIERILFADGEDAFSDRLIGLSVIGRIVKFRDTLADVMQIAEHFAAKINHQIAVIDMTQMDPSAGRFLSVGNYRMKGDGGGPSKISDIPNPVQRKQVIEDYFMARALAVPLYAKIRARMNGERWYYDRILVPIRTQDLSILISAFWHQDAAATEKF